MQRLKDALITAGCTILSRVCAPMRRAPAPPEAPSVLVLKPCCLGDLLLATAALAALRARFPASRIVVATSAWSRPAIEGNPNVDEIMDCDGVGSGGLPGLRAARRLAGALRRERFDVAVVLDRSPVVAAAPWLAGIPVRAGIDSGGRGFSLTHRTPALPLRHEAQLYLDVVSTLGSAGTAPALAYVASEQDAMWAAGVLPAGPWLAVHPGGGVNPGSTLLGKRWPVERYVETVRQFLNVGWSVALLGGAEDRVLANVFHEMLGDTGPHNAQLADFCGQTSFAQLGALLQRCALFVGNDTGPMHLAVAVGTPVVAVFGPSQPEVYGPWALESEAVYHGERCQGCRFRGGLAASCAHQYACTAAVTVGEVLAAAKRVLGRAGVDVTFF